jgi:hypothetical protein
MKRKHLGRQQETRSLSWRWALADEDEQPARSSFGDLMNKLFASAKEAAGSRHLTSLTRSGRVAASMRRGRTPRRVAAESIHRFSDVAAPHKGAIADHRKRSVDPSCFQLGEDAPAVRPDAARESGSDP